MNLKSLLLTAITLIIASQLAMAEKVELKSPDGKIKVTISDESGQIRYSVDVEGKPLIAPSVLGYDISKATTAKSNIDKWTMLVRKQPNTTDQTWTPVFGKRATIRNQYNETELRIKDESQIIHAVLLMRVYDDGIAFRNVIYPLSKTPGATENLRLNRSLAEFNFVEDLAWWSYRKEQTPAGPTPASKINGSISYPIVSQTAAGKHVAVLEAHLRELTPMDLASRKDEKGFYLNGPANIALPSLPFQMPWRVIMIGDTAGDLIDSDLIMNLNPKADKKDFEWFKPGVAFWDWRAWGYKADDGFTYDLNLESWKRFIDFAAETGVPYLLLDADWYGNEFSAGSDPISGGKAEDVKKAILYGQEKGVGLILYLNHVAAMKYGIEKIIPAYADWGAKGIKYGFMQMSGVTQTTWTHKVAQLCAENKLMVNFHDGPLPPTGEETYMPNFVHREFCHAQSDAMRAFEPDHFINMAHVNMLAGPIDQNNGMFDLVDSEKQRPKVFRQINSTILAEAARTLITYGGGMTVIPDAADSYRKHKELFRFISEQKTPWTESKTLSSKINEHISMMRQSGDTYLVGSCTNAETRDLEIDLSFLPKGKTFTATIFSDKPESHYMKERMAYNISKQTVTAEDTIKAHIAPGSGHCMIIEEK